ncbi:uncharacterized protein LOC126781200 [Nymphalis io]|uniref:uncharacterized protein LOC126781200 n=1 Tax=Inachis io TaxID=171585 RepID=UPI002166F763|nr:uncharacterized protein LOC126781200 [Nymphalis io]
MWNSRSYLTIISALFTLSAMSAGPCSDLRTQWLRGPRDIPLRVKGDEMPVTVLGEGGAPRAAAALLLVTIRDVLGFSAHLELATANLCDLAARTNYLRSIAVVAPVAYWPSKGCNARNHHVDMVTTLALPASEFSIHLLARVSRETCKDLISNLTFYLSSAILNNCGFIESKTISTQNRDCEKCFAVLARNESEHDIGVAIELQRRIRDSKLPLQIVYFQTDLHLRTKILQLQQQNRSFLFLDENIWTSKPNILPVQLPLCVNTAGCFPYALDPSKAVRVGNGEFMKRFAPPISNFVNRFGPETTDLRGIIENEIYLKNISNIEEAACSWALQNKNKIENWTNSTNDNHLPVYIFQIYICEDDPDLEEYLKVINIAAYLLRADIQEVDYNLWLMKINCVDSQNITLQIMELARKQQVAGAIAMGLMVTDAAARAADNGQLPLMLAGPTLPEVPLDTAHSVYAITAPLMNLTHAYLELLQRCNWMRVAILSDNTTYSKVFINMLLNEKKLLIREEIVNLKNIRIALEKFRTADARIFFVNTNSNISGVILCTALDLGMTPDAGFVWIVRDWRKAKCIAEKDWGGMYHITLGLTWRGGPTAGGSRVMQSELRKLWHTYNNVLTGSANSASLADAFLFLAHGFANFHNEYPSHMYDLRGFGNAQNFSKIMQKLTLNGTAQELKINGGEKLVFIEKWYGNRGSSVALWYITLKGVVDVWPNNSTTCTQIVGIQPTDRYHCITFTTGDPFAPRCHLLTISITITILTLAIISLYVARRARLSSISRREQEESQRAVSWLDSYLVQRNSIKLFHEIGSGSNGQVRFAELRKPDETILVAAKEPHESVGLFKENELLREACLLALLNHENIIRLIGVCVGGGPPIVLMEHAYYNDLHRYLTFRRQFVISARSGQVTDQEAMEVSEGELTRFAREAARALEYLTSKRLVHRDVRAANCLVDKNRLLKLADFGMARKLDSEADLYMTRRRSLFPVLWMPPESLIQGLFSPASDIWSLGVLILEVCTLGARPYNDWPLEQVFHYVRSGGHPPLPPDTSKHTRSLVLACWQQDVKARPSAAFIHDFLTRNPYVISPALLTPDMPEPNLYFIKRDRTFEEIKRSRRKTSKNRVV